MKLTLAFLLIAIAATLPLAAAAPLSATVSRSTINVGQTAVVTLAGGQLDVAGYNTVGDFGDEFAHAVQVKKVDRNHFEVKGVAACDCVLKFSDGKNETTVKLKVVKK